MLLSLFLLLQPLLDRELFHKTAPWEASIATNIKKIRSGDLFHTQLLNFDVLHYAIDIKLDFPGDSIINAKTARKQGNKERLINLSTCHL